MEGVVVLGGSVGEVKFYSKFPFFVGFVPYGQLDFSLFRKRLVQLHTIHEVLLGIGELVELSQIDHFQIDVVGLRVELFLKEELGRFFRPYSYLLGETDF